MDSCKGCRSSSMRIHGRGRRRTRRTKRGGGSVRMKVKKLQKLIPGGKGINPDRLFLMTADYILHLRLQLNVLQALSNTVNASASVTTINQSLNNQEIVEEIRKTLS